MFRNFLLLLFLLFLASIVVFRQEERTVELPFGTYREVEDNDSSSSSSSGRRPQNQTQHEKTGLNVNESDAFFIQTSNRTESSRISKNGNIFLLHVGKAGGTTLRAFLRAGCNAMRNKRRRNQCNKNLPRSMLSDRVKALVHCFVTSPANVNFTSMDAFLFSLRHPVDRSLSWYHMTIPCHVGPEGDGCRSNIQKEYGIKFVKCFPNVEQWAQSLLGADPKDSSLVNATTTNCTQLAWDSLAGRVPAVHRAFASHIYFNIRWYERFSLGRFPAKETLVVRTEHIWDDIKALDIFLGGNGTFAGREGYHHTHGTEKVKKGTLQSAQSVLAMCCALLDELTVYRELINKAVNLPEHDKTLTLRHSYERCGQGSWEALQSSCESRLAPNQAQSMHRCNA